MSNDTPQASMDAFVAAMIRRDMNAALALLTDDVALFYSNGSALWGKEQFATAMTAAWKGVDYYQYRTLDSIWLVQSNTAAAVIYTYSWSGVADGKNVRGEGRGTRVFRRDGDEGSSRDAKWRIAHEHLSVGQWK